MKETFKTTTRTFAIFKPNLFTNKHNVRVRMSDILEIMYNNKFVIINLRQMALSLQDVELFYKEHKGKPFYEDLCGFMSSGISIGMILEKEGDAISDWRKLIGNTNPFKAEHNTLRYIYRNCIISNFEKPSQNSFHGSDSVESYKRESDIWFNIFV